MLPTFGLSASARLAATAQTALSPRQQQAVRLLQMPSADYAQVLRQAVCDNPFLEWAEEGWAEERQETPAAGEDEPPEGQDPWPTGGPAEADEWMDRLVGPVTLAEHLAGQLRLLKLPLRERLMALAVAACLDEDGYLRVPLADLGAALPVLQPPPAGPEWSLALARVQALEPAGVGARHLGECLALQLRAAPSLAPALTPLALAIVQDHLPALASRDLAGIARRLGQPLAQVQAACERIRRLDPRPGWRIGAPAAGTVTPDVVVRRGPGRPGQPGPWVAHLNPAALPRLRLQQSYADWCLRHRAQAGPGLGQQLQEARWTLRNVDQRFATILAVARAILQRQHRFLALGPLALRPLALKEIAQAVGVHESTVSRVTHQKYMATPCGLFELRFFFSRGLATDSGGHCSPSAVRGLIRELVAAEPREAPLSDVDLARALAAQGLRVARRTVTKYRQQLRIEPAPRRGPSIR